MSAQWWRIMMMRSGQLPQSPTHLFGLRKCLPGRCASLLTRCFTFRKASRLFHARLSHFKPFPRLLFPTLIHLEVKVLSDDCLSVGGICYQLNLGDSCQHVCPGEIIIIIFLLIYLLLWSVLSSFSSSPHIAQPLLLVCCFWILFWFSQFASPCLHTLYTNSYHSRVLKNIKLIYCQR